MDIVMRLLTHSNCATNFQIGIAYPLLMLSISFVYEQPANAQNEPSVTAMREAWQERQRKARSFSVSWHTEYTEQIPSVASKGNPFEEASAQAPTVRFDAKYDRRLIVSGEQFLFEDERPVWNHSVNAKMSRSSTIVRDRDTIKELTKIRGIENTFKLQGLVMANDAKPMQIYELSVDPVFQHFRPIERLEAVLANAVLQSTRGTVDDKECLLLEYRQKRTNGLSVTKYWVSPSEGYSIRRIVRENLNGEIQIQQDRHYKEVDHEWIPTRWSILVHDRESNQLARSHAAIVTDCETGNEVPPSTFNLTFPKKTFVVDESGSRQLFYVVEKDGEMRPVSHGQFADTPEEILQQTTITWKAVSVWLVVTIVGCMGVYFVARQRK